MPQPQYLDNSELLSRFVAWRSGPDFPERIPLPITNALMLLVRRLADRPNFSGYSFREDMRSQALVDCVRAARLFDPAVSRNPFGYFTTVSWYAFIGTIRSERKQRGAHTIAFSEFTGEKLPTPDRPEVLHNASTLGGLTLSQLRLILRVIDNPPARSSPSTKRELRRLGCLTVGDVTALVERERRRLVQAGVL